MSPRSHVVIGWTLVLVLCFSLGQAQQQNQAEVEAQEVAQGQGPIVYRARITSSLGQANQGASSANTVTEAPDIEAPELPQGETAVVQPWSPNSPGGTASTYPPNYEYEAPETPEVTSPLPTTGVSVPNTPTQTVGPVPRQPSYNKQEVRGAAGSVSRSGQIRPATSVVQQPRHHVMSQATKAMKTHIMRNLFEQFRKMAEHHQYDLQKMHAAMQKSGSSSVSVQRGPSVYDASQGNSQTFTSGQSGPSVYDASQGNSQTFTSGQSGTSVYGASQGNSQTPTSGQSGPSVYDASQGNTQTSTSGQSGTSVYDASQGNSQTFTSGQSGTSVYDASQGNNQTPTSGQSGPSVYDASQGNTQTSTSGQSGTSVYDASQGNSQTFTSGQSGTSVYDASQGNNQTPTSGQSGTSVYDASQGNSQTFTSGQSGPSVYGTTQGNLPTSTSSPIWVPVYVAGRWSKEKYNPGQTEAPVYPVGQGSIETSTPNQIGYESSTGTEPSVTAAQTSIQPVEQTTAAFQTGGHYADATSTQTSVIDQTGAQTTTSAPVKDGAQTAPFTGYLAELLAGVYPRPQAVTGQPTTQPVPAAGQDRSSVTDQTPASMKEIVPVKAIENSVNTKLRHPLEPRLSPVPNTDPYSAAGNMLAPISNAEFGAIMQRMLVQRLRKYISSQRKFPAYNPGH